jgi:isoquinoline 1-oxidoreductase beta subunit
MAQVPVLDIFFVETGAPLGGLGEVGLPPVAPALANAMFAATGQRTRALPVRAASPAA